MPSEKPPPRDEHLAPTSRPNKAPIADRRAAFTRKTPQTTEDRAAARAFIDGKIEMVRRDPRLTDAQKAAAIFDLESKR